MREVSQRSSVSEAAETLLSIRANMAEGNRRDDRVLSVAAARRCHSRGRVLLCLLSLVTGTTSARLFFLPLSVRLFFSLHCLLSFSGHFFFFSLRKRAREREREGEKQRRGSGHSFVSLAERTRICPSSSSSLPYKRRSRRRGRKISPYNNYYSRSLSLSPIHTHNRTDPLSLSRALLLVIDVVVQFIYKFISLRLEKTKTYTFLC